MFNYKQQKYELQWEQYILAKRNLKLKINEAFVINYPEFSSSILAFMN